MLSRCRHGSQLHDEGEKEFVRTAEPLHPFLRPKGDRQAPGDAEGLWATGRRLLRGDMAKTIHPNKSWGDMYRPLETENRIDGGCVACFFGGVFLWVCLVVFGTQKLHQREQTKR